MNKNKILNFIDQVRQEVTKVTWPSKKEVTSSTVMIMVIVGITSVLFLFLDIIIHNIIKIILNF